MKLFYNIHLFRYADTLSFQDMNIIHGLKRYENLLRFYLLYTSVHL